MKKKLIAVLLPIALICCSCTANNIADELDIKSHIVENGNDKFGQKDYLSVFSVLNKPILVDSLDLMGLTEQEVNQYLDNIAGPFTETINTGGIFPPELVGMFEKVLYDYRYKENERGFADSYIKTVQNLGACNCKVSIDDLYALFPEIREYKSEIKSPSDAYKFIQFPDNCYRVFRLPLKSDGIYYVIEYQSGGTNGACSVQFTKLLDGNKTIINEFEIQNYGAGEVIQYDSDYYYVFIQYNYNLKTDDGIRIHKLGEHADTENILIRYLPKEYIWKNIRELQIDCKGELEQYIESIKDIITSEYLDNGTGKVSVFNEDEANDTVKILTEDFVIEYGSIDFANLGIPVYLTKGLYFPDTSHDSMCLLSEFYIRDSQKDSFIELEKLRLDLETSRELKLIQLWFKEIGGKIFTFRIYHISSYNYVFDVSLIEGDNVTRVRTDLLLAQKKYVLTEGEKFVAY